MHGLLTQMTENTNNVHYKYNLQDILNAWQKDTPEKTPDNRQVIDNVQAYVRDKKGITVIKY